MHGRLDMEKKKKKYVHDDITGSRDIMSISKGQVYEYKQVAKTKFRIYVLGADDTLKGQ